MRDSNDCWNSGKSRITVYRTIYPLIILNLLESAPGPRGGPRKAPILRNDAVLVVTQPTDQTAVFYFPAGNKAYKFKFRGGNKSFCAEILCTVLFPKGDKKPDFILEGQNISRVHLVVMT